MSVLTQKDFYKTDHRRQYPKGTNCVYSNFTARSDNHAVKLSGVTESKVMFFGLQAFIADYLKVEFQVTFFDIPKEIAIVRYQRRLDNALGKGAVPMDHIEALHDLGYLPLRIKALPEGSLVPMKVPMVTITNTHPDFAWLVNDIETVFSSELWKPITTATTARHFRKLLTQYAEATGAPLEFVDIQAHDFSFRGMSGRHDAAINGMAHLVSFIGTDTIPAIDAAEHYYSANSDNEAIGFSVPATEHSVMCMGEKESEITTFSRLINDLYPAGIVSIVSDTWDFFKVITEYASDLKEDILARKDILDEEGNIVVPGKTVFRPDSGDPADILCGSYRVEIPEIFTEEIDSDLNTFINGYFSDEIDDEYSQDCGQGYCCDDTVTRLFYLDGDLKEAVFDINVVSRGDRLYWVDRVSLIEIRDGYLTPEEKGAVECLWEVFGGTRTEKGFRVLNDRVGLIYGDSITLEKANEILSRLQAKGFASCNTVFGVGSYTYQYVTRDTYGMAIKATYGEVNGGGREIFKDPATDSGVKKSAKGLLRVEKENGEYVLYDQQTWEQEAQGELRVVFEDGEMKNIQTFEEIRERAKSEL